MRDQNLEAQRVIKAADTLIMDVAYLGLNDAVQLLKIARLELLVQLNGIRPHELKAVAGAVAQRAGDPRLGVTLSRKSIRRMRPKKRPGRVLESRVGGSH